MSIQLSRLVYDPTKGHDVSHSSNVDYNPDAFADIPSAAKGLYDAIVKYAIKREGYTAEMVESEIRLWGPERTQQYSGYDQWCVVWEAGPHDWAIGMSMQIQGPWGHCEPYYGFDLHFTA